MGQVHKKHVKFINMELQDQARSGLNILSRGHVVSGDIEMIGVGIVQVWLRLETGMGI